MENSRYKFRAWDKDSKVMRLWEDLILTKDDGDDFWLIGYKENACITSFDHEQILMQYTGLKDKNGVEIYEGDIVRYFRNELAVIVYRNGGVDIRSLSWKECEPLQKRLGEIEVIGNIYQNKDLI